MIRIKKDSLEWLQFEHLSTFKNLKHGIFTRHGGVSTGSVRSLNFGSFIAEDRAENVIQNNLLAKDALGIPHLFWSNQCHKDNCIDVKLENFDPSNLIEADGLMTSEKHLGLVCKHADCQAAIFYDPKNHVIANIHSGWRGSVANIYQKAVERMKALYGTDPKDLLVGISPSLGPEAAEFINYEIELPKHFYRFQVKPTYFDFWEISKMQLEKAGILKQNIEIAQICTFSNPQDWFSYRYDKKSGRNATIVALL